MAKRLTDHQINEIRGARLSIRWNYYVYLFKFEILLIDNLDISICLFKFELKLDGGAFRSKLDGEIRGAPLVFKNDYKS